MASVLKPALERKDSDLEMQAPLVEKNNSHDSNDSSSNTANGTENGDEKNTRASLEKQNKHALRSCIMYSFCSVSMILTNKSLASGYNHFIEGDLNILLVVFQAIVAVICVEICKKMSWVTYPNFNWQTARLWAPVNILFCGMLFTGMASLQYNSVPMVTIFKNITNIVVTAGDFYCFGTKVDNLIMVAFGIMLSGAVAAAWNDIYISYSGIFWMAMNCLSTAGYILYLKFATKNVKLSKFGMVFYNNVLCTVFLLPVAFMMGQVHVFFKTPELHTMDYFLKNMWAGFVGFFLNFASLNCVQATGPTTYAIVGSLNKVPVTFLGYVLFDNIITQETWFFIVISLCGGFLYSFAKIQEARKRAATATSK